MSLQRKENDDGEQQAIERPRPDPRQERRLIPVASFAVLTETSGEIAGEQGDAQEYDHGFGDLPRRGADGTLLQAKPTGEDRQIEPAQSGEHDDLEDGV